MKMKIENQVCTLEQAKKLKALGIKQVGSLFYASTMDGHRIVFKDEEKNYVLFGRGSCEVTEKSIIATAFTVAELGEILGNVKYKSFGFPMMFTSHSMNYDGASELMGKWSCSFRNPKNFSNPDIGCESEAQARAAMLIYLLENKIISAEEVNKKLK